MSELDHRRRAAAHIIVEPSDVDLDHLGLEDRTEHHLRRVLRLRGGELVTVTDGAGRWRAHEVSMTSDSITLLACSEIATEPRRQPILTIAAAIPKGDRLDWMVQKTTECGVDRLMLLECDRSVVRWKPDRVERQLQRLRRIAEEAVRQSRRVWVPEIVGPTRASEILPDAATAEPGGEPLSARFRTIAIGPEGGWSRAEQGTMSLCVDLGPHVLRTETAAVVATTLSVVRHP